MDVNFFVEGAKLVNLATKRGLLELPVSDGDVALLSIEETPSYCVRTAQMNVSVYDVKHCTYSRVVSSLIPSTTSCSPRPTGLFRRPCASQSLLKELNAESSCVDRLLMDSTAVSSLILATLLSLLLLLTDGGGVGGVASLLSRRSSGNDREAGAGAPSSAAAW